LPSTSGDEKSTILNALDKLQAGGSTAGAAGIQLAYEVAAKNFIEEGNNRVILATDGDFNVGVSNDNELEHMIVEKRKSGIFLTCLGVGMGNYKDAKLETLADKGNGNFAYLNDIQEANKVFVTEFGGTLFTIAKDVKIQVEFNPAKVKAYRLVGYENRMLNEEDFKDDTKDAGELGAGHTVTAIYEIIPVGVQSHFNKDVDELKYQKTAESIVNDVSNEIATVKFRYKNPNGDKSIEMVHPVMDTREDISQTSNNFKFSAAVAMFGMLLRNSEYKGNGTLQEVIKLATESRGVDKDGYRAEFIRLVKTADNGAFNLSENNN
jgi:Ca-activated chloride channel homolog